MQTALIKSRENIKYIKIYENSDCYLEIYFTRSKVYHKQLHHDLALKELTRLEEKVTAKMEGYESHALITQIYDECGEIKANLGLGDYEKQFGRAIDIRSKQMGKYNILNAISYCNYAKYLMMNKDMRGAEENLSHAVEIFSCMSNDHPINWVIYFSNAIFSEMKEEYKEADSLMKSSLRMAEKKFDNSHITLKKVRLRMAKILLKMGEIDESFR